MNKYLKLYESHSQYVEPEIKPNVSYCKQENEVHYNPYSYADEYLTFDALEGGTFTFTLNKNVSTDEVQSISYSLDGGENWATTDNINDQIVTITTPIISRGNSVIWKGNANRLGKNASLSNGIPLGATVISSTNSFNAKGNIMSLLYGDEYKNKVDLTDKNYCFTYLFKDCTGLTSAENLSLPATTLANHCYYGMFQGCTNLTTAPELSATVLTEYCYYSMFGGCTSLTTAPELPATTLANECYGIMFDSCTSLTTAPELPATTLADWCYAFMFDGCTNLASSPELPATVLTEYCYDGMFRDCTSLVTAPELPATTLATNCYYQMFYGCTSLTTAPELPATNLVPGSTYAGVYSNMFGGCTSLTTAPELPATTLTSRCYLYMFRGCTSLNSITCLATDISANGCTTNWVDGVASSGTFIKAPSMTGWTTGVNGIPSGWTVETATE